MPTDENILEDIIQLFFIFLFNIFLFNYLFIYLCFNYLGVLQISGNGLGEMELNQEEVDCELERRRYIIVGEFPSQVIYL